MEVYNAAAQEYTDAYMLQSNGLTGHYAPQDLDQFGAMYREGMPEFVVDQGMYYPTPANYGYVCTGLESPVEWDDRQMVFGLDGLDVHYPGAESENSPYVYCTPNVAFAQSPYNPYNPYIPGAMLGVDGSFMGAQQYYNLPSYDNQSSSPMYFPMLVQSRSDVNAHNTSFSFVDTISSTAYRADRPSLKNNLSSASPAFNVTPWLSAANQSNSHRRASDGNGAVAGSSKRSVAKGSATSSGPFHPASAPNINGRSVQGVENVAPGKTLASRTQAKVGLSSGNAFSSYRPSIHALSTADKVQSKFNFGKVHNETKTCADKPREQNQVPKIDISGNKLTVRAFTSKAGDTDTQGNITIHLDQYDKNDFLVDYPNAKFFIIKSYSEDDVHKSIKYNVWSSTPNGNKKLNSAYEGAQRISHAASGSCPIFLFFSVNASGQFCGVAEMTGPVDFHKDMDFWQQDKWTGSFPVKWHIVKDVPNFNFRHIILENNDNKPVTNSRDTQEVPFKKGTEMLKIFRSYLSKTSLLDDFLYYENRQRILQEEKTRLLLKKFNSPFFVAVQEPPRKHNSASDEQDKITRANGSTSSDLDKGMVAADANSVVDKSADANSFVDKGADADSIVDKGADVDSIADKGADANSIVDKGADANSIVDKGADSTKIGASVLNGEANMEEALKIGSLTLTSTYSGPGLLEDTTSTVPDSTSNDVVTVGSIAVKVNGYAEPSGLLTVGTIQFDPRVGQDLIDGSLKRGTRKG